MSAQCDITEYAPFAAVSLALEDSEAVGDPAVNVGVGLAERWWQAVIGMRLDPGTSHHQKKEIDARDAG